MRYIRSKPDFSTIPSPDPTLPLIAGAEGFIVFEYENVPEDEANHIILNEALRGRSLSQEGVEILGKEYYYHRESSTFYIVARVRYNPIPAVADVTRTEDVVTLTLIAIILAMCVVGAVVFREPIKRFANATANLFEIFNSLAESTIEVTTRSGVLPISMILLGIIFILFLLGKIKEMV